MQQCCISTAFFNIVRGVQNIYDGDSIQNVGWQTVGKLTSSNSGVSDYILQICLPKPNFPCKAALSWHPEMKDPAMTRSTLNNSGFQAPALLDLTFTTSPKSVYVHTQLYNMQTNLWAATETPTDTKQPAKRKCFFSQWQYLEMAPNMACKWMDVFFFSSVLKICAKKWSSQLACGVTCLYSSSSHAKPC